MYIHLHNYSYYCGCYQYGIKLYTSKKLPDHLVSCPDPALCEGKGLGTNAKILGCADSAIPISVMWLLACTATVLYIYTYVRVRNNVMWYSVGCHSYIDDCQELSFDWLTGKQDCWVSTTKDLHFSPQTFPLAEEAGSGSRDYRSLRRCLSSTIWC